MVGVWPIALRQVTAAADFSAMCIMKGPTHPLLELAKILERGGRAASSSAFTAMT
jgi:hypothetical protein